MTKKKKITLLTFSLLFIIILSTILIYYFGVTYPNYNKSKIDEFKIPGLNEKFVPQGFDFDETTKNYFISGYMADESASRIYCINENNTNNYKYITLQIDNVQHTGHLGGIAVGENFVWVASDKIVYRIEKQDIVDAENSNKINIIDHFTTGNGADSITLFDNKLWVGEFYMKNKYETPTNHHIEIQDNEINRAVAYCYEIDETKPYGLKSTTPIMGLSLPDKVQGFDFTNDGKIILSTSYSIPSSNIFIHENVFTQENKTVIDLQFGELPVYKVCAKNQLSKIDAPSMSEEIIVINDRLFILYESACSKYKLVNRTRIDMVQSIAIN